MTGKGNWDNRQTGDRSLAGRKQGDFQCRRTGGGRKIRDFCGSILKRSFVLTVRCRRGLSGISAGRGVLGAAG